MAQSTIAAFPGALMLGFDYDPTGLEWVVVRDSYVLAWVTDLSLIGPPEPVFLGPVPVGNPPDTGDVVSPPYVARAGGAGTPFVVPRTTLRGDAHTVLNFIASNNGAQRYVYCDFADPMLIGAWREWAQNNPLALTEVPLIPAVPAP